MEINFRIVALVFIAINLIALVMFLLKFVPNVGNFLRLVDSWTYRLLRSSTALFFDLLVLALAILWLLTSKR